MAAFAPTPFALAAAAVPELTLVGVQPGPENPDFYCHELPVTIIENAGLRHAHAHTERTSADKM